MFSGLFGSEAPGIDRRLYGGFRKEMERVAGRTEDYFDEYDSWLSGMRDFSMDLMANVIPAQMDAFNKQLGMSDEMYQMAKNDRAYYDTHYKPIEQQLRKDALTWDSEGKTRQAMAEARASTAQAFDAQKQNRRAQLESFGIDPSETRSQALDRGYDIAKAAAMAGESNKADNVREQQALQLRGQAQQQGNYIANRGLSTAGQSARIGTGAIGAGNNIMGGANAMQGTQTAGYGQGHNMLAGVGNQYSNVSNQYLAGHQARLATHAGTVDPMQAIWGMGSNIAGGIAGSGGFNAPGGGSWFGSDGGVVPEPASPAPPGPIHTDPAQTDTVRAGLTPGEFVIPEPAVRWKGEEYFHKQVAKASEDAAKAKGQPAGAIPQQQVA